MFDESKLYEKFLDMVTLKQSVASEYFREYEGAVA